MIPSALKSFRLRVSNACPCASAVAAIAMSAKPGDRPVERARSDRAPADVAAFRSNDTSRSPNLASTRSHHVANASAFRVAPVRRAFAMPSRASVAVMTERKSSADFQSIQSTRSYGRSRWDSARAEITFVSSRSLTGLRREFGHYASARCPRP